MKTLEFAKTQVEVNKGKPREEMWKEIVEALEYRAPKFRHIIDPIYGSWECPSCGSEFDHSYNYCPDCGQEIYQSVEDIKDWLDELTNENMGNQ